MKNDSHYGLQFAWSRDRLKWEAIGNGYGYLKCDYGRWGSEKKMFSPYLFKGNDGRWHCIWSVNSTDHVLAHASSLDLIHWESQAYPDFKGLASCLESMICYNSRDSNFLVNFRDGNSHYYQTVTKDFKKFSNASLISADKYYNDRLIISLAGENMIGQVQKVAWNVVEKLTEYYQSWEYRENLYRENAGTNVDRLNLLYPVEVKIKLKHTEIKPISDILIGVFFEDINYAADGGLYGELVQNRDFEYSLADRSGSDTTWNSKHSWRLRGEGGSLKIDTVNPIHTNNPNYAVLATRGHKAFLENDGFDGIPVQKSEVYNLSLFARKTIQTGKVQIEASLIYGDRTLAKRVFTIGSSHWQKLNIALSSVDSSSHAVLRLRPLSAGAVNLDMVSLFPAHTFKNRPNGLRNDLARSIADIHPKFIRFPGGCVTHGDGLANIYRWKNTIGPLESRKPQRNLWGYHQSVGLGFFEYFQYCEDIGASAVPVLAAGVPCQNSGTGGAGQQGGIPMNQMADYIQDIIDLVEYANGPTDSHWGKLRAKAGHPKPFNLKYIGIGNEDLISDVFKERFTLIFNALKKAHPEITVIGTVGPASEGTDYQEGWMVANSLNVPIVDEHYYQPPGWFINNQEFYDGYDRSKSKVYLGEYAAHVKGRASNIEAALSEALYLTAIERNGDVVRMASYAPLLARDKHIQWAPDLIYFNNKGVYPTESYYVQQLYGRNAGTSYIPSKVLLNTSEEAVMRRIGESVVRDPETNDLIVKLVNILPTDVKVSLDFDSLISGESKAVKTELYGLPGDKDTKPVQSEISVNNKTDLTLHSYSFTVLRIRM